LNLKNNVKFITEMKVLGKKRKVDIELKWGGCKLNGERCYVLKSKVVKIEGLQEISEKLKDNMA
ncbi:MAG: hypothetical protein AB1630_12085, partial [bacterium]